MAQNNNGGNKIVRTETWVLIVQIERGTGFEERPNPVLGEFGLPIRVQTETDREIVLKKIQITEPMLVIPDGNSINKIEFFPVTGPMVLHSRNFKRVLNP